MDQKEKAIAFLKPDPIYYVNLLEVLRRDSAQLLAVEEGGVILLDRESGSYMFALREGGKALLDHIPQNASLITGCNMWALPLLEERLGLSWKMVVHSVAWLSPKPPELPVIPGLELRQLDRSWVPWAAGHYSTDFGGAAYMEGVVNRGLLCAFVNGDPAGFIGFHEEGSIGLLEVLPQYRRRGLGKFLELAAIRLALNRGQYAFGQVETGNEPSLALQRKLGLAVSEKTLFWLGK